MKFIMNFLRSPFQFRSTDQANKKSDSASPVVENMFIDPTTGISTDPKWRATSPGIGTSSSVPGSPRLQHRVPGFENNGSRPIEVIHEPAVTQSSNEDGEKGQRVRVVPIKVESVDDSSSPKKRPGPFYSSSGTIPRSGQFGPLHPGFEELHNRKRHSSGPALPKKSETTESQPKVCNIPIFVEGRDAPVVPKTSPSSQNVPVHNVTPPPPERQNATAKQNGGNLAKCASKPTQKQEAKQKNSDISLKQILDILAEFQKLKTSVDDFKGAPQDKQYRYLDEMLTRCMLKLDNVETYGDDEVRASRKAAVKAIEKCITDLETRAQANSKAEQPVMEANQSEEMPNDSLEQTVSVDTQKTTEIINAANSSALNEQCVAEESDKSLCPERRNSTETKPELTEGSHILAENIECMDTSDANQNCERVEDAASMPMVVDEMGATPELEEPRQGTQVPVDQAVDSCKTSEVLPGTISEPMETTGLIDVPSQTVDLPVDSEVPEVKAKSHLADSEMAELGSQSVSTEDNSVEVGN